MCARRLLDPVWPRPVRDADGVVDGSAAHGGWKDSSRVPARSLARRPCGDDCCLLLASRRHRRCFALTDRQLERNTVFRCSPGLLPIQMADPMIRSAAWVVPACKRNHRRRSLGRRRWRGVCGGGGRRPIWQRRRRGLTAISALVTPTKVLLTASCAIPGLARAIAVFIHVDFPSLAPNSFCPQTFLRGNQGSTAFSFGSCASRAPACTRLGCRLLICMNSHTQNQGTSEPGARNHSTSMARSSRVPLIKMRPFLHGPSLTSRFYEA